MMLIVQGAISVSEALLSKDLELYSPSGKSEIIDKTQVRSTRRRVAGIWAFVVALRLLDGKLLILITSKSPQAALADYARRWQIETLFSCFKSRGFNLEATHLSRRERLSKLLALLTIALLWSLRIS